MPHVAIRIPQIGEGLQEARLVAVLKQPGERVRRDEPIYQMETDKAVMDVECPYDGVLVEWLAAPDDVLAIGAEVARIEVADAVPEGADEPVGELAPGTGVTGTGASDAPGADAAGGRLTGIPPRTRAYAKEKGVGDADLARLAGGKAKLMPADIDAFLASGAPASASSRAYQDNPLPPAQRLLASRLVRASRLAVPGTISVATGWAAIDNERARQKASGDAFQPSAFTMFAYAVVQALKEHPAFRSTLVNDDTLRTYTNVSLGIAVARPGDELVLAVVDDADTLDWRTFAERTRGQIEAAREGRDQAHEAVTVSLTNMQAFGLRDAIPVVVPPAVGTLFLGEVYLGQDPHTEEPRLRRTANLALTFDHRVVNGVGAANFLNAVKDRVERIASILV